MAAQSLTWVCGCPLVVVTVSNPAVGMDVCLFVSVVHFQIEVSASGLSLVWRSLTGCGVFGCHRETSITRRLWPTGGCCAMGGIEVVICH